MVVHRVLLSQTASRTTLGAVIVSKLSPFLIGDASKKRRWDSSAARDCFPRVIRGSR